MHLSVGQGLFLPTEQGSVHEDADSARTTRTMCGDDSEIFRENNKNGVWGGHRLREDNKQGVWGGHRFRENNEHGVWGGHRLRENNEHV